MSNLKHPTVHRYLTKKFNIRAWVALALPMKGDSVTTSTRSQDWDCQWQTRTLSHLLVSKSDSESLTQLNPYSGERTKRAHRLHWQCRRPLPTKKESRHPPSPSLLLAVTKFESRRYLPRLDRRQPGRRFLPP